MAEQTQKSVVRFGVFEVSFESGELRKHGLLIRVPGQPFKILAMLLERPGAIVTRDELRKRLWSEETFVDFEHSLNSAIKRLREALRDSAESPRYIETLPRLGYRFIAPVSLGGPETAIGLRPQPAAPSPPTAPPLPHRPASSKLLPIAIVILAVGFAIWYALSHRRPPITEQDTILLADFENRTGDTAFDGTLQKVLEVEISQSPYLNVLPDQKVRETLEYMRRRTDEPVTRQVGLEVCQRNAVKAMLTGSIGSLGNRYVLTLEALNCATGSVVAGATAEAESKERVLQVLGDATSKVRRKLGESLASIQKFGTPIEQATTASLDALKMYAQGEDLRRQGKEIEAIPSYKRATELDPQFGLAYARLGTVYANLREQGLARQYLEKAFQLRGRSSERERLYMTARYYGSVSGEAGKALANYAMWRIAYPRDWLPARNLAAIYSDIGQNEKAIEAAREAVRLNADNVAPYEALASAYKRACRFAEAKSTCADAIAKGLESWNVHSVLYQVAFVERDTATMQRQAEWGMGKPTEDQTLRIEAWAAATAGRLRESRQLFEGASAAARGNGFANRAAVAVAEQGLIEAAFHDFAAAKKHATAALALEGATVRGEAGLILAEAGDLSRAESLAAGLVRERPLDTFTNEVSVPAIRAEVEIRRGRPARAIDLLRNSTQFEIHDLHVPYIRGSAYLSARMGTEAVREFQKILKNRGVGAILPHYPLAHIGLARAYALQGDQAASRREYEAFFALWKDADPDVPILREARRAYTALVRATR